MSIGPTYIKTILISLGAKSSTSPTIFLLRLNYESFVSEQLFFFLSIISISTSTKNAGLRDLNLDIFEGMAHHGNEHVGENDDDSNMVECEEEQSDPFDDRRCVVTTWKAVGEEVSLCLRRIFNLDALHSNQTKHRPEKTEQRPRHSERINKTSRPNSSIDSSIWK